MIDLRFPTALQIMLTLALAEEQGCAPLTSTQLALGLGANPSLVRTLMVPLARCGLLLATRGKAGGIRLGRRAADVTLADIYRAAAGEKKLWTPRFGVPRQCVVSSNIGQVVEQLAVAADEAVIEILARRTLAETLAELSEEQGALRD